MITEKDLLELKTFGKEKDGSFSDRWQFAIIQSCDKKYWEFYYESEVDGDLTYITKLDDMDDLRDTYFQITNKKLE